MKSTLYYVHDPMCSWCWAFRPVWTDVLSKLPNQCSVVGVLGGLAPDTEAPMPAQMQAKIQRIWSTIQMQVPGTRFNFDFWTECQPRRSTYGACRAVIAALKQGPQFEWSMVLAIQTAYYLAARNPSDDATLIELADSLGLQQTRFVEDLNSTETRQELDRQIDLSRSMGGTGFPSIVLDSGGKFTAITIDYVDSGSILDQIHRSLDA